MAENYRYLGVFIVTRLKSKVFSLVSFWSPPPSLRQRVKYDGWDRETGVGGPFLNLGVA